MPSPADVLSLRPGKNVSPSAAAAGAVGRSDAASSEDIRSSLLVKTDGCGSGSVLYRARVGLFSAENSLSESGSSSLDSSTVLNLSRAGLLSPSISSFVFSALNFSALLLNIVISRAMTDFFARRQPISAGFSRGARSKSKRVFTSRGCLAAC
ncbi:hypothetical protein M3J09_009597 [Ascochyta lentis]